MSTEEVMELNSKCTHPVNFENEQWFLMEAIRESLLNDLKRTDPDKVVKIYNRLRRTIRFVRIKELN